ncbi:hypothetical protein E2C01_025107 [Portunus trituberculatus]|uniref:Uncharacterized protein n=1 Tax=Portunus trituberculatus TaxID=210409 RepID=A0A5B7EC49_PORTR|nr:hypothetical protein [Portunus trituberculatus]
MFFRLQRQVQLPSCFSSDRIANVTFLVWNGCVCVILDGQLAIPCSFCWAALPCWSGLSLALSHGSSSSSSSSSCTTTLFVLLLLLVSVADLRYPGQVMVS